VTARERTEGVGKLLQFHTPPGPETEVLQFHTPPGPETEGEGFEPHLLRGQGFPPLDRGRRLKLFYDFFNP